MTTTIKSSESDRRMTLDLSDRDAVITIFSGDVIAVDAPAFLDAVRIELGVLTVDGGQEPLAQWELELLGTTDAAILTADHAEALAAYYANLAAEKRKTPPVDEQQVEALTAALIEAGLREKVVPAMVARRLAESGYRIEKVQS